MSKHTPGPWIWDGISDLNCFRENGNDDSVIFCTVEYDDGHFPVLHCEQADRNLIAAAPDLIEACEEFINQACIGEINIDKLYVQMKAAIKKAKGDKS